MLAISPLENASHDGRGAEVGVVENFSAVGGADDNFSNAFSSGNLLEDIDFDDLFVGFDDDGDVLPDLEVDPNEILAEFSVGGSGEEESERTTAAATSVDQVVKSEDPDRPEDGGRREVDKSFSGEEVAEAPDHDRQKAAGADAAANSPAVAAEADRDRKPAPAPSKGTSQGKRKLKVDWTPELHRRFVQAVEQLGVDKAVPSRILEIMGIDCLTRHNIASHLQKYRSHRKHLLAREAEAASWSQRRHMYGGGAAGGVHKREMTTTTTTTTWLAPTMGFPPPPPPTPAVQPFRSLHVWGHPTVDHAMMHMWPKHLLPSTRSTPPPPPWAPQHPPADTSFWHHPHYPRGPREGWVPNALPQGTPCFPPQPLPPPTRFPPAPVPGIPPHPMYRPDNNNNHNTAPLSGKQLQFDLHPSKESIDAALGDVLSKPWLPLPLGLKPPSMDSVLVELQKQGISKIPPSCAS